MNPGITVICIVATFVCLLPAALYAFRITKDPFHPFIFVGALSFFLITFKTFSTQEQLTEILEPSDIILYSVIMIFSLLGYYAGWGLSRRRTRLHGLPPEASRKYDPAKLLAFGFGFAIVGLVTHIFFVHDTTTTGYLIDLQTLWIIGAIMIIQAIVIERRYMMIGLIGIAICLIHPVYKIFDYGQRGDTVRLGIVAMVPFLALSRRPPRVIVIAGAALLAILASSLDLTRSLVDSGEARNRVDALFMVGPAFFKKSDKRLSGAEEWYYGPAAVKTAWMSGRYGWGRVFLVALPLRFLPKEIAPWKYDYYYNHISFDRIEVPAYTGLHIPWGAAPTGFAEGYVEFWWFFPLFWGAIGFFHQRSYARGIRNDLKSHAMLIAFSIALTYLITQEILFASMNLIYTALPSFIFYRYCRLPEGQVREFPALAAQT